MVSIDRFHCISLGACATLPFSFANSLPVVQSIRPGCDHPQSKAIRILLWICSSAQPKVFHSDLVAKEIQV